VRRYRQRLDPRTGSAYYEHRAMAEWKWGRKLSPSEVVHHVNGDKGDNHPQNIWVFSSQEAHMMWHHYEVDPSVKTLIGPDLSYTSSLP
jgi:hypothetical protein